jgi:hypothetical protein
VVFRELKFFEREDVSAWKVESLHQSNIELGELESSLTSLLLDLVYDWIHIHEEVLKHVEIRRLGGVQVCGLRLIYAEIFNFFKPKVAPSPAHLALLDGAMSVAPVVNNAYFSNLLFLMPTASRIIHRTCRITTLLHCFVRPVLWFLALLSSVLSL